MARSRTRIPWALGAALAATVLAGAGAPRAVAQAPVLSPLADSLAPLVVLAPVGQRWFVAAVRAKRLLVDVGRVDARTKGDSARTAAVLEVASRQSTVPVGTPFVLRGAWGHDTAHVTGFDVWNGRLVATLAIADSLAARAAKESGLVASAERVEAAVDSVVPAAPPVSAPTVAASGAPPTPPAIVPPDCTAEEAPALPDSLRVRFVRDSLTSIVRAAVPPLTVGERRRGRRTPTLRTTRVAVCTADGPAMLVAVSLRGHLDEWVRERVVEVRPGGVRDRKLRDLRFKGHELLAAFDADGDGFADLATRAVAELSGGTTILRWNPATSQYERLAAGFQWESR